MLIYYNKAYFLEYYVSILYYVISYKNIILKTKNTLFYI